MPFRIVLTPSEIKESALKPENKKLMLYLLCNSVLLFAIYFLLAVKFQFLYITYIYLAVGAVGALYFVVYNRGFVGKDITPDMLPDTMSLSEKQRFIEESKARLHKSRWILTILIPIIFTILADIVYVFLFPQLQEIFL